MAEENLIRMLYREPSLYQRNRGMGELSFSVPMFGRIYGAWEKCWKEDIPLSPGALSELLSPQEMAHLCGLLQNNEVIISEAAFDDCFRIIREEGNKTEDLLALQARMKQKKGYGGT
jgi:hypothetical protein